MYLEYEEFRIKYFKAQQAYDIVLSEKEELFSKTLPNAVRFDKEKVGGSATGNTFDDYLIAVERKRIDERLKLAKQCMDARWELLQQKEEELRKSSDIKDRLYVYRVLDHLKMQRITPKVNYSESHIYRLLGEIYWEVKKMRENENFDVLE